MEDRMIRYLVAVFIILGIFGCDRHEPISSQPTSSVQQSFADLKAALRNENGAEAVKFATPTTLDLYEQCRRLAIDSSGADIESFSQPEVLLIFQLRWLLDAATLQSMNGNGVFSWCVDNGLISKQTLEQIELDKVQIEGTMAMATLRKQGQPVTDLVFFQLHDGIWKLDFVKIIKQVEPAFDALRKKTGKTKVETAVYLLGKKYKKEIPPQILNGPLK